MSNQNNFEILQTTTLLGKGKIERKNDEPMRVIILTQISALIKMHLECAAQCIKQK